MPPRQPAELHLIRGNPKRRPVDVGTKSREPLKPCPRGESGIVKRIWSARARDWKLLLCQQDHRALLNYCRLAAEIEELRADVLLHGRFTTTEAGTTVLRAEARHLRDVEAAERKFLVEFGATPAARTRVPAKTLTFGQARRAKVDDLLT